MGHRTSQVEEQATTKCFPFFFFFFKYLLPYLPDIFLIELLEDHAVTNAILHKNFHKLSQIAFGIRITAFEKTRFSISKIFFYKSYNLLFLPREMSLCDFNTFTPQGTRLYTS